MVRYMWSMYSVRVRCGHYITQTTKHRDKTLTTYSTELLTNYKTIKLLTNYKTKNYNRIRTIN